MVLTKVLAGSISQEVNRDIVRRNLFEIYQTSGTGEPEQEKKAVQLLNLFCHNPHSATLHRLSYFECNLRSDPTCGAGTGHRVTASHGEDW